MIGGVPIIWSVRCTKDTEERNFPHSRHRSARIHRKLLKRFDGYLYKQEPAIVMSMNRIIAHPAFKPEIEKQFKASVLQDPLLLRMGGLFR